MRALIIGGGAIGQYMAARLAQAGYEAIIFSRAAQADELNRGGITLQDDSSISKWTVRATADTKDAKLQQPFELAVVAVKAFSTAEAAATIQSIASCANATILTVQNGLGNEEELADVFGAGRIIAGALTVAVDRIDATTIAPTKKGGLCLAPLDESPHNWLIALMSSTGLIVRAVNDWRALKWSKLCINILGNGVCAALDWSPAQVYGDRTAFTVERACLLETIAVMDKLSLPPVSLIDFPVPRLVWAARTMPPSLLRVVLGSRVARGRGGKLPSLLLDLRAGKKQTEVNALNGAVALNAVKVGLEAPTNSKISSVVSGIASGQITWSDYRGHPEKL
jgi:2-dehydropantoate 2-reductase